MKRTLTFLGLIVSLACIVFFAQSIAHHWTAISTTEWSSGVLISMLVSLVIYLATYGLVSYAWGQSLDALAHPIPYREATRILTLSQFAKYLPGNVGHHVGRVVLAKRAGLPTDTILGSMILDTLIVLAAAGLCSFPALRLLLEVVRAHGPAFSRAVAVILSAGLIIAIAITMLGFTRRLLKRQFRHVLHLVKPRNVPLLGKALIAHVSSVLTGGTALYLLCISFAQGPSSVHWLDVTGIYAVAWLLGFLIPGAPAGLGVREIVLMLGLSPLFGANASTAAAAALRMVTIVGDGLAFAVGLTLRATSEALRDPTIKPGAPS